ncbi:MAG: hypothetical protein ACYS8W_02955 [Planctomycetota bacterium]
MSEFVLDRLKEGQKKSLDLGRRVTLFALACETGLLSKKQQEVIGEALQKVTGGAQAIKKSSDLRVSKAEDDDGLIKPDRQRVIGAEPVEDALPSISPGEDPDSDEFETPTDVPAMVAPKRKRRHEPPAHETAAVSGEPGAGSPIRMLVAIIGVVLLLGGIIVIGVFIYLGESQPPPVDEARLAYDGLLSRLAVEKMDDDKRLELIQAFRRRFPTSDYAAEAEAEVKEIEGRIRERAVERMAQDLVVRAAVTDIAQLRVVKADIRAFLKSNPASRQAAKLLGLIKDIERRIADAELDVRWHEYCKPVDEFISKDRFADALAALDADSDMAKLTRAKEYREEILRLGRSRYNELSASARNKAAAGDLTGAINVYRGIADNFGFPEYVDKSLRGIATIREEAKKPGVETFAGAEQANRKARLAALGGKFEAAIRILDDFANGSGVGPAVETIRRRTRYLETAPTFAKAVASGLGMLVGKNFTVKKASGITFTGKVLRADVTSFDLKLQGRTVTVKWDELESGQIMRLGVGAYPGAMLEAWPAALSWLIAKGELEAAKAHLPELQEQTASETISAWIDEWEEDSLLYKPTRLFFARKELKMEGKWDNVAPTKASCNGGTLMVTFPPGPAYRFSVGVRSLEPGTKINIVFPAGRIAYSWSVQTGGPAWLSDGKAKEGDISHEWPLSRYEKYSLEIRIYGKEAVGYMDGMEVWKVDLAKSNEENREYVSIQVKSGALEISEPVLTQYRLISPKK